MSDETNTTTEIAVVPVAHLPAIPDSMDNYINPQRFDQIAKLANVFANSDLVPAHFKGKKENCFIALQMAFRSNIDPMVALQNLYLVQGKPGMSAQLAIALANRSGLLKGPIRFAVSGAGDNMSVTASATTRDGYEISAEASMAMARAENWTKNPKYQSMPKVMLTYRAATFLVRQYMPEVLLGMQAHEELEDVQAAATPPTQDERMKTFDEVQKKAKKTASPAAVKPAPIVDNADSAFGEPAAPTPGGDSSGTSTAKSESPPSSPAPVCRAYAVIDQLIGQVSSPSTREILTSLRGRRLLAGDEHHIASGVREANAGSPKNLNDLLRVRTETVTV
jgi:hypothetical protein